MAGRRRVRLAAVIAAIAAAALTGPASAAPPALSPSTIGEAPQGAGVFRFPQAVATSPGGSVVWVADQYSGVVQAFGADGTPRRTVGARASRREPGRFGVIGGLATDRSGHLYVLDAENDRVQVLSADDGHPLASFGDATTFDLLAGDPATGAGVSASGIAVAQPSPDAQPVVYIADQGDDRVDRFVLDPTTLQPVGPPLISGPGVDLSAPQGVALDPGSTRLYVADDDHHRVVVLDPGTLAPLGAVGTFGAGPGQFQNPYDVAVDDHSPEQLYVADNLNNRVDVFDAASLGFLGTFGRPGYGPGVGNMQVVRAVGALTDVPGGGVIAADTANNRVQAFDASGNVTAAWGIAGRGAGYVTRPRGVAFAPDGGVAVADSFDHRIALFAPDGTFVGLRGLVSAMTGFATQGAGAGQYSLPGGVAYDAAGDLWIADTGNDRVVELDPSGAVLRTTAAGLLADPEGITAGADGMYVADSGHGQVVRFDATGTPTVVRSGLVHPTAVAPPPAGSGTGYVGDDTSLRDLATGTPIAGPDGSLAWDHITGLALSSDGNTLDVAERRPSVPNGARVVRGTLSGSGFSWDTIATEGDGAGLVIEPGGLALSPDGGTLLVADTGNNRVLRFDAPGHGPAPRGTVSVGVNDLTRGTVVSDLPGIACPTDCRQTFGVGRQVTLTATPASGSVLTGWTGACAGAGGAPACTLTVTGDVAAGATFAAAPPVPSAPPPPAPAVRITSIRLSTHLLHRARRHRPARRATRARVTVTLTRSATLTIGVEQGRPGRRQGSRCRVPTRANRRRARCTRFVALRRTRTLSAPSTTATFTLTPTFAGASLAPGSYRLAIVALDSDGNRVGPSRANFRVTR